MNTSEPKQALTTTLDHSDTTHCSETTKSHSDRRRACANVYQALQADFKDQFKFSDEQEALHWKQRCWERLKGYPSRAIIDGYDLAVRESGHRCPNLVDIHTAVKREHYRVLNEADVISEAMRNERIPVFDGLAGYVETVLAPNAAGNPLADRNLAKMRDILKRTLPKFNRKTGRLDDETSARIDENKRIIDSQIDMGGKLSMATNVNGENLSCSVPGCRKPGVTSRSTVGGTWLCRDHFRR